MRVGCAGCLTVVAFWSLLGVGAVGAGGWVVLRLGQSPDIQIPATTQADNARAQRKVADLLRRRGQASPDGKAVVFNEQELNALIARGVAQEIPLATPVARLPEGGRLQFAGRLPLRHLLEERPFSRLTTVLPQPWLDRPVWLQVYARVSLEHAPRPYARLSIDEFHVGRQRLPVLLLRLLLDPGSLTLLRLPLPDNVEDIRIEPGHVIIRTAS
jgi:hypothetical protein